MKKVKKITLGLAVALVIGFGAFLGTPKEASAVSRRHNNCTNFSGMCTTAGGLVYAKSPQTHLDHMH